MQKILFLLLCIELAVAAPMLNIGFLKGSMSPNNDAITQQTWGKSELWQWILGVVDSRTGWEFRTGLGHYSDVSHNPADASLPINIHVTPLTGSIFFHFTRVGSLIEPYIGLGVGAYLYSIDDATHVVIEYGTKFGGHGAIGVKLNISNFYVTAEYSQTLVSPIFFNNATNFDAWQMIVGIGATVPFQDKPRAYRYSNIEEELLLKIQELTTHIEDVKRNRSQLEQEVDAFYNATEYDEASPAFSRALRKVTYQEKKIAKLDNLLTQEAVSVVALRAEWQKVRADNIALDDQLIYLRTHYSDSPNGLNYSDGYIMRKDVMVLPKRNGDDVLMQDTIAAPLPTEEEKQAVLAKKKARLEALKNRQ